MKTILCDIGGVLLNVNFDRVFDRLCQKSGLAEQEIRDRIFSSGIKEKHDLGVISSNEFYDALFVDDLSENVDAANRLGIKSHLFVDAAGFKRFVENAIEKEIS